jgi:hypothetical protein
MCHSRSPCGPSMAGGFFKTASARMVPIPTAAMASNRDDPDALDLTVPRPRVHPPTPVTAVDMRGRCYAANTSSEQANWLPVVSRRRVPALIKPTRERVADTLSTRRHRTRSQRQFALALASDDLARLVPTERAVHNPRSRGPTMTKLQPDYFTAFSGLKMSRDAQAYWSWSSTRAVA